jgi:hypothetical protein
MKYLITIIAALGLAGYAFVKGASINDGEHGQIMSPCAPQSIAAAKNPDARYSHCQDKDWDGSTLLRDRLTEAQAHPDLYGIILKSNHIPQLMIPDGMTTDDDSEPLTLPEKPSPTHRGSL